MLSSLEAISSSRGGFFVVVLQCSTFGCFHYDLFSFLVFIPVRGRGGVGGTEELLVRLGFFGRYIASLSFVWLGWVASVCTGRHSGFSGHWTPKLYVQGNVACHVSPFPQALGGGSSFPPQRKGEILVN